MAARLSVLLADSENAYMSFSAPTWRWPARWRLAPRLPRLAAPLFPSFRLLYTEKE